MYIILGGTGNVGSSVAETLLEKGEDVTVVTHDSKKVSEWEQKGAKAAVVDVLDTDKLREVFRTGKRAFLLNPPGDIAKDNVTEEKRTVASILKALEDSGIEKVVAESVYGAQPGDGIGDLGVLFELEQGLRKLNIPADIARASYYMSNWAMSLESAKKEGVVHTLYPPDFKLPMVSPEDIGKINARFLMEDSSGVRIHYVEGPEEYSSADVAEAFSKALGKPVKAVQTPPENWFETLKETGFSDIAANSMVKMTQLTLEAAERPESPVRGTTTLDEYIENTVKK